ncbi:unannotated protein [freshwater metagenome]|uniref:Unannotated protein n=1 Tax=freshwater metagenome TaxID=449393 RepID=A0A6J6PIC7_9ZZZZ
MPSPIRDLTDRVFDELLASEPHLRARAGLPIERLKVPSLEARQEDVRFARSVLADLDAAPVESDEDRLNAGFLRHLMGGVVSRGEHDDLGFGVTPYQTWGLKVSLGYAFQGFAGSDATYADLTADYRDTVRELRVRLLRQRELGILVPRAALPGVRESLDRMRASSRAVLTASAPTGLADSSLIDEVDAEFGLLDDALGDDYAAAAPQEACLSRYPGGESYYRFLVKDLTSSDLTPEQLHETGLQQCAELAERMAEVRSQLGFTGSEQEFHAMLATDPRVHARDHEEVNALFRRHMAALEPRIGDWFAVLPQAPYDVERLDPALEAGMTYGFYEAPTATQPTGYYRWNGVDLENKSLLTYAALIFHELAPGHHFHLARQAENTDLPPLRREPLLGAFNEGWAEYASGLGWEMGLYDDPLDAYGRLTHERFTAQRLVVDTGLNLMGWSLEQAASFMSANTTESDAQVASEVLRYSTDLPAQALGYRAGYLELMRLRARAEKSWGERFDVRDFHELVLGPGALPFPVIEESVDRVARSVPTD